MYDGLLLADALSVRFRETLRGKQKQIVWKDIKNDVKILFRNVRLLPPPSTSRSDRQRPASPQDRVRQDAPDAAGLDHRTDNMILAATN